MTALASSVPPTQAVAEVIGRLRSRGVLLADDDLLQREFTRSALNLLGVTEVTEVTNGAEALRALSSMSSLPALIILDLQMPVLDGFETMRQIAARGLRVPILIVSGGQTPVLDCMSALADELGLQLLGAVTKPLSATAVERLLSRYPMVRPSEPARLQPREVSIDDLTRALGQGWIVPDYQPKVALNDGRLFGVEALARWREPDGITRSPMEFIGLAEREGLIDPLTLHLLSLCLTQLHGWAAVSFLPQLAINVSARSLSRREFVDELISRVEHAEVDPQRLVLEVTETAAPNDLAAALGNLGRLRMRGYGLAIDDYGTGLSSLQQLSRMPFSEIKIDRSLVRHADDSPRQRAILASAIDVGHRLGLHTVVEGIETAAELSVVRGLGAEQAQGFLLARPMHGDLLPAWAMGSREHLRSLCAA